MLICSQFGSIFFITLYMLLKLHILAVINEQAVLNVRTIRYATCSDI